MSERRAARVACVPVAVAAVILAMLLVIPNALAATPEVIWRAPTATELTEFEQIPTTAPEYYSTHQACTTHVPTSYSTAYTMSVAAPVLIALSWHSTSSTASGVVVTLDNRTNGTPVSQSYIVLGNNGVVTNGTMGNVRFHVVNFTNSTGSAPREHRAAVWVESNSTTFKYLKVGADSNARLASDLGATGTVGELAQLDCVAGDGAARVYDPGFVAMPDPPANFTSEVSTVDGTVGVNLTWEQNATGATPTGYRLVKNHTFAPTCTQPSEATNATNWGNGDGYTELNVPAPLAYRDELVTPGLTYHYAIWAYTAGGDSGCSTTSVYVPNPPGDPENFLAAPAWEAGGSYIRFTWDAPSSGGDVVEYRMVANPVIGNFGTCPQGAEAVDGLDWRENDGYRVFDIEGGNDWTIDGFSLGTTYSFGLYAVNADGPSSCVSGESAPANQPGSPGLTASTVSTTEVNLSWSAGTGSVSATGYSIWYKTGGSDSVPSPMSNSSNYTYYGHVDGTTATVSGLSPATTYSFRVAGTTASGIGGASNNAQNATLGTGIVLVATPSNEIVYLDWNVVTGVTNHLVFVSTSPHAVTSPMNDSGYTYFDATTLTTWSLGGLTNGVRYHFRVVPVTAGGEGTPSNDASATPFGDATQPLNLNATGYEEKVNLRWSAPAYRGSPLFTTYRIYRDCEANTSFCAIGNVSRQSLTFTDHDSGACYTRTYVVRTIMPNGNTSDASNEAEAFPYTLIDVPLFGDEGSIYGAEAVPCADAVAGGRDTVAAAVLIPGDALDILFGILVTLMVTLVGYSFFQVLGASLGGAVGSVLSMILGFWPWWVVFFLLILGAAVFLLLHNRRDE